MAMQDSQKVSTLPHGHVKFTGELKGMLIILHGQSTSNGGLHGRLLVLALPHGHARSIRGFEDM